MPEKADRFRDWAPTLLRIAVGGLLLAHGWTKVFGGLGRFTEIITTKLGMPSYLAYVSAYTEFLGGLLIMLGLLTRLAALFAAGNMAVAIWKVHSKVLANLGSGSNGVNEYPLLLLFCCLALMIWGAGNISVDKNVFKWRF